MLELSDFEKDKQASLQSEQNDKLAEKLSIVRGKLNHFNPKNTLLNHMTKKSKSPSKSESIVFDDPKSPKLSACATKSVSAQQKIYRTSPVKRVKTENEDMMVVENKLKKLKLSSDVAKDDSEKWGGACARTSKCEPQVNADEDKLVDINKINQQIVNGKCIESVEAQIGCDEPKLDIELCESECAMVETRNELSTVSATPKKPQKLLDMKLSTLKCSMRSPMKSAYMNYINKPSGRRTQRVAPKSACASRRLDFIIDIEKGGGCGAPKK